MEELNQGMDKKGSVLVMCFMVITVFSIMSAAMFAGSVSENVFTKRYSEFTQAFWLAEAGANKALDELRVSYATTSVADTAMGAGGYSATITNNPDGTRTVTSAGFIPYLAPFRVQRAIQVVMNKLPMVPPNFYNSALYSAGNVVIKGNSYDIEGDVIYAGTISSNTGNIDGTITHDPAISPLASLSFNQLRAISKSQGNYHNSSQLNGPFPNTFWYDEAAGIPNVVFLEGNLDLTGKTSVGGFFVVGGEVIYDAVISGNVSVKGCIYTRGNFTINGGGNSLNIEGGVWTGTGATLNGNAKIDYHGTYMQAIQNLGIDTDVQVISWLDTQNPY